MHCYAAWSCQSAEGGEEGGSGKDPATSLGLVGPWVTQSSWKSWDVWRDPGESCVWCWVCSVWMGGLLKTLLRMHSNIGQVWRKGHRSLANVHVRRALNSQHLLAHQCWSVHFLFVVIWLPGPVWRSFCSDVLSPTDYQTDKSISGFNTDED